ncbi:MFS transporter [Pseudomonadota bacterium]
MSLASQIDHQPMSRYQVVAIIVCTIINMMDGFDVLVVAFTAPSLAVDWELSATAIGALLSAGLVGMILGSLALGPLADRYGRRPLVLFCLVLISLGMLASAVTQNVTQLMWTRVITGLGIGGMLPSLNTIVAEFSSLRRRSFAISFLQAGYPVGATLGGIIAAVLIAQFGWRSVYAVAGLVSSLMIFVAWRRLPESLDYLVTRQPPRALAKINHLMRNMGRPQVAVIPARPTAHAREKTGYAALPATPGLMATTALLCVAFFMVMLSFYFVLSWTPKILVDTGLSISQGISGGVLLNIGGIVGSIVLGYVSVRLKINKLIAVYMLITTGLMALFANVTTFNAGMLALTLSLGFFIFGSIVGLYALAPHLYPVRCRSSGLSMAIGIGRLGGVSSPLLAGYLLDHSWAQQDIFIVFAGPLLLSAMVVLGLTARRRQP